MFNLPVILVLKFEFKTFYLLNLTRQKKSSDFPGPNIEHKYINVRMFLQKKKNMTTIFYTEQTVYLRVQSDGRQRYLNTGTKNVTDVIARKRLWQK